MQKRLYLAGLPAPRAIGIDEISIRKGHSGFVSDLDRELSVVKAEKSDIDLFFKAEARKRVPASVAAGYWKAFRLDHEKRTDATHHL